MVKRRSKKEKVLLQGLTAEDRLIYDSLDSNDLEAIEHNIKIIQVRIIKLQKEIDSYKRLLEDPDEETRIDFVASERESSIEGKLNKEKVIDMNFGSNTTKEISVDNRIIELEQNLTILQSELSKQLLVKQRLREDFIIL